MNEEERVTLIEQGINHPFWTDYLRPLLAEKAKNAIRALAAGKSDNDDVRRGQYQAYQDIFDTPMREVDSYKREQEVRDSDAAANIRSDLRAELGYTSPFSTPLEPGALSEAESDESGLSAATARETVNG
ncbi:hypothetical protein LCGC14_2927830 [marine sediment metagenome]|uniref:Uncharacterized protein n=1 Tax=marine sediment metagenome TaxID=412755 RepID=A0A0F8ZUG0_9ZZZZ